MGRTSTMRRAVQIPSETLQRAKVWSARLNDEQRELAGQLAKEIKKGGLDTGMIRRFDALDAPSFNMETLLRVFQWPSHRIKTLEEQFVALLEKAAEDSF